MNNKIVVKKIVCELTKLYIFISLKAIFNLYHY